MKRYLILCLLLALLIPILVMPAAASEYQALTDILSTVSNWWYTWSDYFIVEGTFWRELGRVLTNTFTTVDYCLERLDGYFLDEDPSCGAGLDYDNDGEIDFYYTVFMQDLLVVLDVALGPWYDHWTQFIAGVSSYMSTVSSRLSTIVNTYLSPIKTYTSDIKMYVESIYEEFMGFLEGGTSVSGEVEDQVSTDQTEASEFLDVLDDVTKPDEGELEEIADISGYVDLGDVSALSDVLKPLFESSVFLPCIMLNLTFMLVGYVLFGKR